MSTYSVHLPDYTVGPHALGALPTVLAPLGKRVTILGGETALQKATPTLLPALEEAQAHVLGVHVYGKDSTQTNVEKFVQHPDVQAADILIAVGGGRAIDTVKTVADLVGKPYLSVPTVASNCAPVTSIAVIYKDDGALSHYHFCKHCPVHTFIDLDIILDSPYPLFWAGVGDALSKGIEVAYVSHGKTLSHTPLLGVQLAQACEAPLLTHGKAALDAFKAKTLTPAVTEVVLDIIMSTGLVSNLVVSHTYYYNSSLAHCFYNAYTQVPMAEHHLHGEVVSFGNLVLLAYTGQDEKLKTYMDFNRSVGLPTTLAAIGLDEAGLNTLVGIAPSIKEWKEAPDPVTEASFLAAIHRVDALGRSA